jgi:hypothetical protein
VEAENGRFVRRCGFARGVGNEDVLIRRHHDLRRLADRVREELADFAVVVVCHERTGVVVVAIVAAVVVTVMMICFANGIVMMVMLVTWHEPMETMAQHGHTGVSSQQRRGQEFAKGR